MLSERLLEPRAMLSLFDYVDAVYQTIYENLGFCRAALFPDLSAGLTSAIENGRPNPEKTPWLALPILVAEALGKELEPAFPVAAALELGRIAAGCLDEWQDRDTDGALWQSLGAEQTVNLANAMTGLAQLAIGQLAHLDLFPSLHRELALTMVHMSEGQHADLRDSVSLDNYVQVAGAKTGSLLSFGCRAGAMVAGATPEAMTHYGDFGRALGVLAQAWNDLYGVTGNGGKRDMDRKSSLPVIAALALDGRVYSPGSPESQAGELYALTQVQIFYRHASEVLAGCPAAGRLGLFLDRYNIDRLPGRQVAEASDNGENDHAA